MKRLKPTEAEEEGIEPKRIRTEIPAGVTETQIFRSPSSSLSRIYECSACYKKFQFRPRYLAHMRLHLRALAHYRFIDSIKLTRRKLYSCRTCPYRASRRSTLILHKQNHFRLYYTCRICSQSFQHRGIIALIRHKMEHSIPKELKAKKQEVLVSNNYASAGQKASVHVKDSIQVDPAIRKEKGNPEKSKRYTCLVCNYSCSDSGRLWRHQNGHEHVRALKCSVCPFWSDFEAGILNHEKFCHQKVRLPAEKKEFQCSTCPYKTSAKWMLNRHFRRIHSVNEAESFAKNVKSIPKQQLVLKPAALEDLTKEQELISSSKDPGSMPPVPFKRPRGRPKGSTNRGFSKIKLNNGSSTGKTPKVMALAAIKVVSAISSSKNNSTSAPNVKVGNNFRNSKVGQSSLKNNSNSREYNRPANIKFGIDPKIRSVFSIKNDSKNSSNNGVSNAEEIKKVVKKQFSCQICGHSFFHSDRFRKHQIGHEKKGTFKCSECPFWNDNSASIQRHQIFCHGRPIGSPSCKTLKTRPGNALNTRPGKPFKIRPGNALNTRPGKPFKIRPGNALKIRPGKSLKPRRRLEKAKLKRSPFDCSFCGYKTVLMQNLQRHMKNHTTVKSFKCSYCPFWGDAKSVIATHERAYHLEMPLEQ